MYDSNTIVWEKWIDPFNIDDQIENTIENSEPEFLEDDHIEEEKSNTTQESPHHTFKHFKAVATPMGIIPINEEATSGKVFNFWVGHANFNITKPIAEVIENTDGVETLDIFTRYRFRISVGKAFDDSTVMRSINSKVYTELNNAKY
jgi:hypothetical protein